MDRKIVYPGEVPLSADFLSIQRSTMIALAYDTQAWAGTTTVADGLSCIPTSPASLAVQVTAGSLCSLLAVDATSFGSLAADNTHQIMQQGILLDTVSLTLTPPGTSGQAINYLIQVQFQSVDADSTVLAYFNSSNPSVPWTGPNNSGTAQYTSRRGTIAVQAKAGTAATAGTQTTPSPDAGWTGLYAVTVANGATALTSGQIAVLATAPFISVKLPAVPTYVQGGTWCYAIDTAGGANAMAATLSPVPAAYNNMSIFIKKNGTANTGAMTANFNGIGSVSIVDADGAPLASGVMAGGYLAHLVFDGTSFRFMNAPTSTAVGSFTGSSGEGITVGGSSPYPISMNVPGLTTNNSPGNTDLFPYYNQTDVHHRAITWAALVAAMAGSLPGGLLRITPITASGTWTRGANTRHVIVFATGGGGGGGVGLAGQIPGSGGAAGGTALAFVDVTAVPTVAVTIGAQGTAGNAGDGGNGGSTSFGTYAVAAGGAGGYGSATLNGGSSFSPPAGGAASAGDVQITGGAGGNPSVPLSVWFGGTGGGSYWGGAGAGSHTDSGDPTPPASADGAFGSGGGGGCGSSSNKGNGGKGGKGFILVFEFS